MTVIRIGPHTELNVFVIDGNDQADQQIPMLGAGASITSDCRPRHQTPSSPSAADSLTQAPATAP